MNKKAFIILLMAVPAIFGLGSCLSNKGPNEICNPKNSLDWEGVYTGSFQTDSGYIRNIRMRLNRDQTFESYSECVDGSCAPINMNGRFKWDDTGSVIMIDVVDAPMEYKVAKDKLTRQDVYDYVLVKER